MITWSWNFCFVQDYFQSWSCVIWNKRKGVDPIKSGLKRYLWPKTNLYFYGIILMISWENSLVQSFLAFWSVFTKFSSCKVFNQAWVTPYSRLCRTFHTYFSLHILLILWKKNFSRSFMVVLNIARGLIKLQSFQWLNRVLP